MVEMTMDFIIVGAGPAGLQMGYYLKQCGYEYIIIEASPTPGSFFAENPRHRTLISINKRFNHYPEAEFNMRHDWNSLLSDHPDLLFKNYSKELYPSAEDLVKYLADFAEKLELDISYNTRVERISKEKQDGSEMFLLETDCGRSFRSRCVLVATGAVGENVPSASQMPGIEHAETYASHSLQQEKYDNKRVLIIGGGNSAFEVADHLAGNASILHVISPHEVKFAWNTHFVGDLRAINNTVFDMYQLKSLHAMMNFNVRSITKQDDGLLKVEYEHLATHWDNPGRIPFAMVYDHVIACTGWRYVNLDMFAPDCKPETDTDGKFPLMSNMWESSVRDLFFIGTAMQSIDRKAASGFIHGFRYNIRSLVSLLQERYFSIPLPGLHLQPDLEQIAKFILDRVSITDGLYQMNGFLGDVLMFENDDPQTPRYIKDLPVRLVLERQDFRAKRHLVIITLIYGFDKISDDYKAVEFQGVPDFTSKKCALFIHPKLDYYSMGELRDSCALHESLVLRFNADDYPQWPSVFSRNIMKNFINKHLHYTDEVFEEEKFLEMFRSMTKPLSDEEKSKITTELADGPGQCRASMQLPQTETPKRILPLNQSQQHHVIANSQS